MYVDPGVCPGTHPSVPRALLRNGDDLRDGLALVDAVVRQVLAAYGPVLPLEDMASLGRMGLLEAMDRFDPLRGSSFRHFAACRIRGAILDGMRTEACMPRRAFEAASSDLNVDDADADTELMDMGASPEEALTRAQLVSAALGELDELPPVELALIRRHFLDDEPLERLGPELGISASWASRLLAKALRALRARIESGRQGPRREDAATPTEPGQAASPPRPVAPEAEPAPAPAPERREDAVRQTPSRVATVRCGPLALRERRVSWFRSRAAERVRRERWWEPLVARGPPWRLAPWSSRRGSSGGPALRALRESPRGSAVRPSDRDCGLRRSPPDGVTRGHYGVTIDTIGSCRQSRTFLRRNAPS